jgi:hypothetical protein
VGKRLYLAQEQVPLNELSEATISDVNASRRKWPLRYRVTKVVGALSPRVHDTLDSVEASTYCDNPDWTVEIT